MARKHAFFIVVLLTAAAFAGFVAIFRSVDLAQSAAATGTPALSQSALDARLRDLDRFEARLRKQLKVSSAAPKARQAPVVTQVAAAPAPVAASDDDEDDDEDEDEYDEDDD
jgi:hypothetical protein